jgi:hypothetical protein
MRLVDKNKVEEATGFNISASKALVGLVAVMILVQFFFK